MKPFKLAAATLALACTVSWQAMAQQHSMRIGMVTVNDALDNEGYRSQSILNADFS